VPGGGTLQHLQTLSFNRYLGINLINDTQNLNPRKQKIFLRKMKEDISK
jgi:hypothetical protein